MTREQGGPSGPPIPRYLPPYVCAICDKAIVSNDPDEMHSADDGEDLHADCCRASGPCSRNARCVQGDLGASR